MKQKGKAIQLAMHCRCGCEDMLAHGMCATCYTLRRQDDEHFGGLREAYWTGMATAAAFVTHLEQGSAA